MIFHELLKNSAETLYLVGLSALISIVGGLPLGAYLYQCEASLKKKNALYHIFNAFINTLRSIPFIILMIALLPVVRLLLGTSIGNNAAVVSLSVAAIPFFARITENALKNTSRGFIDAGFTFGASNRQIIWRILIPECIPDLIRGITLTVITLIGYSAMAGAIGAGGLGNYAIQYGYERYNSSVIIATVIVLISLVQLIQWCGNKAAKKCSH
jgi:D-methionine transport system permease protein